MPRAATCRAPSSRCRSRLRLGTTTPVAATTVPSEDCTTGTASERAGVRADGQRWVGAVQISDAAARSTAHLSRTRLALRGHRWLCLVHHRLYLQRRRGHGTTVASMNVLARPSADNDVHHVRARGCVAPRCDVGPARCHARRWGRGAARPTRACARTAECGTRSTVQRHLQLSRAQYGLPPNATGAHGFPPTWEVMRRRADSELTPPGWISGAALEEAGCVS